jgi:hypothetical protein
MSVERGFIPPPYPHDFTPEGICNQISLYFRLKSIGLSEPLKELVQIYVERLGDSFQRSDADFFVPILQFRQVLSRQFGMVCQHGLGPFAFRSQNANAPTDPHANVRCHA